MYIKQDIKEMIVLGNFKRAYKEILNITVDELKTILYEIGYDEENITAYAFMEFLITEEETAEYHCLAAELLNIAFFWIEGAYSASLYHLRRAEMIEPNNIEIKKSFLLYNDIPEKLLSDNEAIEVRKNIEKLKKLSIE